ncbi:MAG: T9SS type A sorting domain-containing protein [Sphingobacteriales bacterium JAD_PAG50586_3]|nr:MAG: T9SS type A sorting domain-containing protein [Sphingobacteriales bacterium JAD_PAG50586_3]
MAYHYWGTKQERINSVALGRGYLFGVGGTNSTNLNVLPSSLSGAYNDNAKSTNNDAFIIKLDTLAGARQWVSYFGGRGFDEAKSITPERTGYMFIVGETTSTDASSSCTPQSDGSFTTCNPGGAAYYQASNNGGREVFLLRIGPNDNLLYSSFFGSNQNDYVYETKMYFSDYYFVGSTKRNSDTTLAYTACTGSISGNFPLCNFQSSSNYFSAGGPASLDSTVSYIATLNDSLALRWCTNVNYVSELQTITAIENYIYTAGITNQAGTAVSKCVPDNDSLSVCHPLVSDSSSANGYVYLMKFAVPTNHSLTWSTLVPYLDDTKLLSAPTALIAEPEEKFLDLAVDQANNLYVAAFSNYLYLNVLPSTLSGMYYQDLKGNVIGDTVFADAVLMSYDNMNRKSWESYFGGGLQYSTINNVLVQPMYCDAPSALATYGNQYLYFAGYSGGSSSFPYMDYNSSSSLDYYQEHQGFDYDAFVSRFSLKSIGVGIQEMEQPDKNGVVLFPNPATNIIYLSDTKFDGEGVSIKVLDITGRVVIDETRKSTSSLIDIDVSSLSSGTYIVQLLSDKFSYSGKFVKQW